MTSSRVLVTRLLTWRLLLGCSWVLSIRHGCRGCQLLLAEQKKLEAAIILCQSLDHGTESAALHDIMLTRTSSCDSCWDAAGSSPGDAAATGSSLSLQKQLDKCHHHRTRLTTTSAALHDIIASFWRPGSSCGDSCWDARGCCSSGAADWLLAEQKTQETTIIICQSLDHIMLTRTFSCDSCWDAAGGCPGDAAVTCPSLSLQT